MFAESQQMQLVRWPRWMRLDPTSSLEERAPPQDTATRTWRESAEQAAASLGTQGPQPPGALKGRGRGLLQGVHRTPWIQTPASGTRGTDFCGTLL